MKLLLCLLPMALLAQELPRITAVPLVVKRVDPEYSAAAKEAGLQGSVVLYVEATAEGKPSKVSVIQGLGLGLDEKAAEAVRQWEFRPRGEGAGLEAFSVELPFVLPSGSAWRVKRSQLRTAAKPEAREVIVQPVLKHYVAPESACGAAPAHVKFTVKADGTPGNIQSVAAGPPPEGLVTAISSWRFAPGTANGVGREATARYRFECGTPEPKSMESAPAERISATVTAPRVAFKVDPEYSEEARAAKYQGRVVLSAVVEPSGFADGILVVKSLGLGLDEKAMQAVSQWIFLPGMKNGEAVRVRVSIEINFKLL